MTDSASLTGSAATLYICDYIILVNSLSKLQRLSNDQLKSLEAFSKAADGKATKIIIPSEIQGIAGLTKSIAEIASDKQAQ